MLLAVLPALAVAAAGAAELPPPWLPLDPGAAECMSDAQGAALHNAALRFAVQVEGRHLLPAALDNGITREPRALTGELFTVTPRASAAVGATRFVLAAPPACSTIAAHPQRREPRSAARVRRSMPTSPTALPGSRSTGARRCAMARTTCARSSASRQPPISIWRA
jgi:hypothetical protein